MRGAYLIESITNVVNNDLPPLSRLRAAKSARFAYKLFILFGLNEFHDIRNSNRVFAQQIRIKRLPASRADISFAVIFTGALFYCRGFAVGTPAFLERVNYFHNGYPVFLCLAFDFIL